MVLYFLIFASVLVLFLIIFILKLCLPKKKNKQENEDNNIEKYYDNIKKIIKGQWVYFLTNPYPKYDENKVGKWIFFFSFDNLEFVENICRQAIEQKIVDECKYQFRKVSNEKSGLACFYLHSDDLNTHKKVIQYFMVNNLIPKTKTGRYHNISFKFDSQTRNNEYGEEFKSKICLSDFIDLETRDWKN